MTNDQKHAVISKYRYALTAPQVTALRCDVKDTFPSHLTMTRHILWMLDEMTAMIPDQTKHDKFYRWLGFVQGWLWTSHKYSIDEMREDNA